MLTMPDLTARQQAIYDFVRERIGADSLHYLSEEGLVEAIGLAETCLACFNGNYPAGLPPEPEVREALELSTPGVRYPLKTF